MPQAGQARGQPAPGAKGAPQEEQCESRTGAPEPAAGPDSGTAEGCGGGI